MSAELQATDDRQHDLAEMTVEWLRVSMGLTKLLPALLSSLLTRATCLLAERRDE